MMSNYRFSYNVSGVGSRYFYAKSSGALAKNEWVYSDGEWYYFDANGYGLSGEKTIDGKTYYFSSGRMMTNYAVSNRLYGADGVKVEGKTGWYLLDGEWYYFKSSGVLYYGMLTLNGNKYYLNPSLYQNSNYFVVSGILYQAKDKNGVLTAITKDGWYEDGSYTYYVKDGKVFSNGWVTSGTSKYYIAGNHMVCNNYHFYISGSYYAFDATGKMFTNTWLKYNSSYVYASSTGALVTGKQVIGGVTYEFNTDGTLKDSLSVSGAVITECTDYGTKTYTLKAGWNEINGVWYYVFNGAVVKGTTMNIGGFTYRFDSMGMMYKNVVYGGCYYDANGAMKKNCWIEHNGKWMYAQESGSLASYGVYEIGGKEYFFIDYYMVEEDFAYGFYIYTLNSDDSIKSIKHTSDDGWYYVNNIPYMIVDGNFYTGWINDAYFERGRKVYNSLLTKNSTYGKDTYYCIENGSLVRNAWCNDDSSYAKADGTLACDEWINLGGTWYYLDDIYYVTGLREIDGVTYYFDKYGRLSKTYTTISDGWHQLDTGWYYGRDGVFVKNEHVYIGGYWYYFDSNGRMLDYYGLTDGREWSMGWHKVTVQKTTDGYYKFPDEAQTVTGWIYVDIEGNSVTGWQNIGGVTYYFDDGIMVTGAKYINGDLHRFADSGAYIGKVATKDGWYYDGKNYFYICNYLVYYNRIEIIDGIRYGFDSEGVMVTNAAFSPYSSYDSYDFYYFGSSGAQVTKEGVYTDKYGDTVYVDGNGHAYTGYVYISGKFVGMTKQKNLDIY
ncbi:MAG: hypothetical protein E7258_00090 [Lachnospiraceae bacterium]|nr:hypothetical protein [Lachnospiraceae bacterium]